MGIGTLLLLSVPLAVLALLARRIVRLGREVRDAESRLARRFYLLQGRVAELDARVRELDFERRRARGELRFEGTTRLDEAFAVHPRVREILGTFGVSGSGCAGGSLDETLTIAEACAAASLDTHAVLEALARFLEDPTRPLESRVASARIYRIQPRPGTR